MKRRYWAPVLAIMAAITILVPSTFAKGQAGDTFGVAFGPNRFPGGLDSATVNLTFESDARVRLDATVQGTDVRSWTIRVYDMGACQRPLHWVVSRAGTDGAGQTVALRVTTNSSVSLFLDPLDVARLRAVPDARNLAFMFAGAGSGGLNSGSAYRTCAVLGNGPVATTTRTTTSNTTSDTTNQTNTSACVTTRTNNGTLTTVTGGTTVIGGTATTLANQTTTVGGTATTVNGTTLTVPGTTTTILGTTNTVTTIGDITTVVGGTTSTVPAVTATIGGTATTISAITTTVGGTTVTVTPVTSTGTGVVTTATGTRSGGTGPCVFP